MLQKLKSLSELGRSRVLLLLVRRDEGEDTACKVERLLGSAFAKGRSACKCRMLAPQRVPSPPSAQRKRCELQSWQAKEDK